MRLQAIVIGCAIGALGACHREATPQPPKEDPLKRTSQTSMRAPSPDERTAPGQAKPLEEPNGSIDPKSVEAAGQIAQNYGALIEQKNWTAARMLWGDAASAAKFEAALAQYSEVHMEIGNPGDAEGAAGSIYVTIPVIFYGDDKDGQPFRRSAEMALRRVNDVPGSTEGERRWHIERIDFAA